jgi:hypothetical protein
VSNHKKGKRDKPTNKSPLPDLTPITEALHDAYSLVWTAIHFIALIPAAWRCRKPSQPSASCDKFCDKVAAKV